MDTTLINVGKLRLRDDARRIDAGTVSALAASMREVGIINPLRVRRRRIFEAGHETDGFEIIAGAHRYEASREAQIDDLPCVIVEADDLDAEMAMIDENLCRAELSPAERARQTARRKALYEEKHPEARSTAAGGGGRANATRRQLGDDIADRFTADTASRIGKPERTVQRDAERGEKISERALSLVAGTSLDTGSYLDKLKKLGPKEQEARVQRELAEPRKPVSPAPTPRNEFESFQAFLAKVVKLFDGVPDDWRERACDHVRPSSIMDRRHA